MLPSPIPEFNLVSAGASRFASSFDSALNWDTLYPQVYQSILPALDSILPDPAQCKDTLAHDSTLANFEEHAAEFFRFNLPDSPTSQSFSLPTTHWSDFSMQASFPWFNSGDHEDSGNSNGYGSGSQGSDSSYSTSSNSRSEQSAEDKINSSIFDSIFNHSFEEKEIHEPYVTPQVDSSPNSTNPMVQQLDSHFSLDNMQPSLLMHEPSLILVMAVLFEMLLPIPQRFKFSGLQKVFNGLAAKVNLPTSSNSQRSFAGIFLSLIILVFVESVVLFLDVFTGFDSIVSLVVMILLLELRYPQEMALKICEPLARQNNDKAKDVLYPFVLREVKKLSTMGIAKAASEACILRIFNGWFAVMVWYLIGGIEAAVLMQCLATLSRAFNFKIPNNYMFGRAVFIFLEVMLAIPALVLGVVLTFSTTPLKSWSEGFKGMQAYPAPATGFVLGAIGGSLDITLGGPRYYFGRLIRLPKLGGTQEPKAETILKSMRKVRLSGIVLLFLAILIDLNF